jgi:hypothetical protein
LSLLRITLSSARDCAENRREEQSQHNCGNASMLMTCTLRY